MESGTSGKEERKAVGSEVFDKLAFDVEVAFGIQRRDLGSLRVQERESISFLGCTYAVREDRLPRP